MSTGVQARADKDHPEAHLKNIIMFMLFIHFRSFNINVPYPFYHIYLW